MSLGATFRLLRAGIVLAREGALSVADNAALPPVMRTAVRFGRMLERPSVRKRGPVENLRHALYALGPTYVKIGLNALRGRIRSFATEHSLATPSSSTSSLRSPKLTRKVRGLAWKA